MRDIIAFVHLSLDGFVAGPNGEMNWITVNEDIFNHAGKRIAQTDAALYGRVTYQMMEGYWPTAGDAPDASEHDKNHSAWYKTAHKIVLSNTLQEADLTNTTVISGDQLSSEIAGIKGGAGSELLVFGSPSATHALMREGLIDGYWLFVNPVVLGQGIPLFAGVKDQQRLKLEGSHTFASGVTELRYSVVR